MKTNDLGSIGLAFLAACQEIKFTEARDVVSLDGVLGALPHVFPMEGYVYECLLPGTSQLGDESVPYARREDIPPLGTRARFGGMLQEGCFEVTEKVTFSPCPEGIWEMFLLHQAWVSLPLWWHANYSKIEYLFDLDRYYEITKTKKYRNIFTGKPLPVRRDLVGPDGKPFRRHYRYPTRADIREVLSHWNDPAILPAVSMDDGTATIVYHFWSDWRGLVKETVPVEWTPDQVCFLDSNEEVLAVYRCGIMF